MDPNTTNPAVPADDQNPMGTPPAAPAGMPEEPAATPMGEPTTPAAGVPEEPAEETPPATDQPAA